MGPILKMEADMGRRGRVGMRGPVGMGMGMGAGVGTGGGSAVEVEEGGRGRIRPGGVMETGVYRIGSSLTY